MAYKNKLLKIADERPLLLGAIALPIVIGMATNATIYGMKRAGLGAAPLATKDEIPDASYSLFGNITGEATTKDLINKKLPYSFDPFYEDTRNKTTPAIVGRSGAGEMYEDTRHKAGRMPGDGTDYEKGILELKDSAPSIYSPSRPMMTRKADDSLVDLIGEGTVFAGIKSEGGFF